MNQLNEKYNISQKDAYLKTRPDTFKDIQTHAGNPKFVSPLIIRDTAEQVNISDLKPENSDII